MFQFIKILLLTLLICLFPFCLQAQCTFTSAGTGNWTTPATWTRTCPAATPLPLPTYPGQYSINDIVIIQPTHTVTLNSGTTVQVASVSLKNQGSNGATLVVNGSATHLIVGPTGGTAANVFVLESKANFIINDALVTIKGAIKTPNNGNAITSGVGTVGYLLVENCARAGGNAGVGVVEASCVNAGNFVDGPLVYCVRCPNTSCDSNGNPTDGIQTESPNGCRLVLLPITLIKLEATYEENKGIFIEWATINEIDNDYFEIEHSITGDSFKSIGKVEGFGNKESITEYKFLDTEFSEGINYYRLKQVDFDGAFTYSKVLTATGKSLTIQPIRVYPNPNNGTALSLQLLNTNQVLSVEVFNMIGVSVYFSKGQESNKDNLQLIFNPKLSKGIYVAKILTKEGISMERFVVE